MKLRTQSPESPLAPPTCFSGVLTPFSVALSPLLASSILKDHDGAVIVSRKQIRRAHQGLSFYLSSKPEGKIVQIKE